MKKKLFGGVFVAALIAVAAININMNSKSESSDLTLANVEALAGSQGSTGLTWEEIIGTLKCPGINYACPTPTYGNVQHNPYLH